MRAPIVICGFNRPDTLKEVFSIVRSAKPDKLYLVLDGPRDGRETDHKGVEECKKIFEGVDWPCEVVRDYAPKNMGCRDRIISAISKVFVNEDRAIILEDDCCPDTSFFRFCDELLEKYKNDSRVGMIGAECEHFHKSNVDFHGDSYYFDRMTCIGAGWATWRRAWKLFDKDLKAFPKMRELGVMNNIFPRKRQVTLWEHNTERLYKKVQKTWAGAWATTMYREGMLAIHSVANVSMNLGYGKTTREGATSLEFLVPGAIVHETEPITFPLQHPISFIPNRSCEVYFLEDMLYRPWWKKVIRQPGVAIRRLMRKCSRG